MRTAKVVRNVPETRQECDQLFYSKRCADCAYGGSTKSADLGNGALWVKCSIRERFYEQDVKEGKLIKCADSNNEEFYKETC
jgi:hypothetical protein